MIRILFIVPYPILEEKVKNVLAQHPLRDELSVTVRVLTVDEAPLNLTGGYDAIIARGYTAKKMAAANPQLPVIPLTISGYDIMRALRECCRYQSPQKVAVIGFDQHLFEVRDLSDVFGIDIEIHTSYHHTELPAIVSTTRKNGCDALIGGYSACLEARRLGMNSVLIETGEATIQQAINEAINTVNQVRLERITSQLYKTILYSSQEGVLYVSRDGEIRLCNRTAVNMNGGAHLKGQSLISSLPYLKESWQSVIHSGKREVLQLITIPGTRMKATIICQPVITDDEVSGVVFTISDITAIQNLESQIRRKMNEKGLTAKYDFEDIIHESREMEDTIDTAKRCAASDSNVIIVGETGTGKELFAQAIHRHSRRKNGPFVVINCAALPENLLESELFGYSEGAFTGASKGGKMGLFEQAHRGTLFLDELEEIPLATQTKLLRVLQERQVRRIGDSKMVDVDVRIISATNKSIRKLCDRGDFRQDLMYRLDVLRLFIPPLRERGGDREVLFRHLLEEECLRNHQQVPELFEEAGKCLMEHPFYGNVRELRNIVERICALSRHPWIDAADMRLAIHPNDLVFDISGDPSMISAREKQDGTFFSSPQSAAEIPGEPSSSTAADERQRILNALRRCGGSRRAAAAELKMDRTTLWRKMKKYDIHG